MKKKLICLILLSILALSMIGCRRIYFDHEKLSRTVERVDLIFMERHDTDPELLRTLEEDEMDEFFYLFSRIRFTARFGGAAVGHLVVVLHLFDGNRRYVGRNATRLRGPEGENLGYSGPRRASWSAWRNLFEQFIDFDADGRW